MLFLSPNAPDVCSANPMGRQWFEINSLPINVDHPSDLLEKYIEHINAPTIIGFSGLPGSGKSTLGLWIDSVARDLGLDIKDKEYQKETDYIKQIEDHINSEEKKYKKYLGD